MKEKEFTMADRGQRRTRPRRTQQELNAYDDLLGAVQEINSENRRTIKQMADERIAHLKHLSYNDLLSSDDLAKEMLLVMIDAALQGIPASASYAEKALNRMRGTPKISAEVAVTRHEDREVTAINAIDAYRQLLAGGRALLAPAVDVDPADDVAADADIVDVNPS